MKREELIRYLSEQGCESTSLPKTPNSSYERVGRRILDLDQEAMEKKKEAGGVESIAFVGFIGFIVFRAIELSAS